VFCTVYLSHIIFSCQRCVQGSQLNDWETLCRASENKCAKHCSSVARHLLITICAVSSRHNDAQNILLSTFTSLSSLDSWPGSRFISHCHFKRCHSSSPHSFMPVYVNKPPTVIAVWQAEALYITTFILFILQLEIIIIIVIIILLPQSENAWQMQRSSEKRWILAPLLLLSFILKLTIVTIFYSIYLPHKRIVFNLSLTLLLVLSAKLLNFITLLLFLNLSTDSKKMRESNTKFSLSHINFSKLVNLFTPALFVHSLHIVALGLPLLSPLVAILLPLVLK